MSVCVCECVCVVRVLESWHHPQACDLSERRSQHPFPGTRDLLPGSCSCHCSAWCNFYIFVLYCVHWHFVLLSVCLFVLQNKGCQTQTWVSMDLLLHDICVVVLCMCVCDARWPEMTLCRRRSKLLLVFLLPLSRAVMLHTQHLVRKLHN